jgi:RNA polymerase sigma factor for flagellar operon FliA
MVNMAEEEYIDQLWKEYKQNNDEKAREELILHYLPMIKSVVNRLSARIPPHITSDELESYGLLGLLDAITKFEPSRGTDFAAYSKIRIKGAVLDELRALDWAPRSLRRKEQKLEEAYNYLEQRIGRSPTEDEIAEFLKIPLKQLHSLLGEINRITYLSLDDILQDPKQSEDNLNLLPLSGKASSYSDPVDELIKSEKRSLVAQAIESLPKQECLVISLYYHEELTLKEVGEVLGVSESRASQIHASAILHLRAKLRQSLG